MVYHARNLDFSPRTYMQDLIYTGIYQRAGKEVYRAQMIAAYMFPSTGLRKGANGYALEQNTRYNTDHHGGDAAILKNLFSSKRALNGWVRRQVLESADTYEEAVA